MHEDDENNSNHNPIEENVNEGNINVGLIRDYKKFSDSDILNIYKTLCKVTASGFWLFIPKTKSLYFSDELIELLDLPEDPGKLLDALYQNGYISEDTKQFFSKVNQLTDDQTEILEHELHLKDGKGIRKNRIYRTKCLKTNSPKSKVVTFIGVVEDITDVKRVQEELAKEKDKAEESNQIKNIFLNNISHEIRTPMNAIIGFTELLNIGELSQQDKQEYIQIIKNKSRNLLSLIDDISELSKFESGEVLLNRTDTNLPKLMNELHQEFLKEKTKENKNNVDIYLKLPTDNAIANIYIDSGRIQQVLNYLLDNALKFTEKGYIQFGYDFKDSKHLLFFVKDTGIGIHKEAQKYLFNRFKHKEAAYDKKHYNSGLGLTISRAIVEYFGGKISVDSTVGQGSTFSFTIPIFKSSTVIEEKAIEKINPLLNWRNKVILIAEDDEVNYQFLEAVLAETQAQLVHVLDGEQAVQLCQTLAKVDLILMDIRLPEKSGYEAVKEIRSIKPNLPIIAQTAYTSKEDRDKCFQVGCNDYISKPIDINLLFDIINKYFTD